METGIRYTDEQHDCLIRGHRQQLADAQATIAALEQRIKELQDKVDEYELGYRGFP